MSGSTGSMADGVLRTTLENGLRVLVRQDSSAAVAAVVTRVLSGYFHEETEQVGLSHLCEHLYFCGTERRPGPEDIAQEVKGLGGELNAGTYYDSTTYYVVLPSSRLDQALDLQADAFANPLFEDTILKNEIGAVIQEAKRKWDNPAAVSNECMYAEAFDVHRIRRWRIGTEEEIARYDAADLRRFWDAHYVPANAILSVVSDKPVDEVLSAIKKHFGALPAGELQREGSPPEPERPPGLRHAVRKMDVRQVTFSLGFPTVPTLHEDAVPLEILAALLTDGRSSRLVRSLKEDKQLVVGIGAFSHEIEDIGLFQISANLQAEKLDEFRVALFEEIGESWRRAPTEEEMTRARNRIEASFVLAGSTMLGQARTLASFESLGDYRLLTRQVGDLMAVTPEDVLRVARTYLDPAKATIFEVVPADEEVADVDAAQLEQDLSAAAGDHPDAEPKPEAAALSEAPSIATSEGEATSWALETLDCGAQLLHRRNPALPAVTLAAAVEGGRCLESASHAGVASLMTSLLTRGTTTRTNAEMAAAIEGLGASLGAMLQGSWWGLSTTLLTRRFEAGAELLFDALLNPIFPEEEMAKQLAVQRQQVAAKEDAALPFASQLARRAAYGDAPPGLPELGTLDSLAVLKRSDVVSAHRREGLGAGLTVAVVGDLELGRARETVSAMLADLGKVGDKVDLPDPAAFQAGNEEIVSRRKEQTSQVLVFDGPAASHRDAAALEVLAACSSGLGGRFFEEIRTKRGLAYVVASSALPGRVGGAFLAALATSPDKEEEARDLLLKEVGRLATEPPEGDELQRAKEYLMGTHVIGLQSNGAQAGSMLTELAFGQGLTALEDYPETVSAVTPEDLARVAATYLDPSAFSLGVLRAEV